MKEPVFKYPDTNSSRANIEWLNRKFEGLKICIVGLGGTGSYILDLVAKTPVQEIHLYDNDLFLLHNAFRSPGAVDDAKLQAVESLTKVGYFTETYARMHNGIKEHPTLVTEDNLQELAKLDFVFLCVDSNKARNVLAKGLMSLGLPFIDVGLGVNKVGDTLIGTVRVTSGSKAKNDHFSRLLGEGDMEENEYATNIQIADLNCLNAALAVIKWKKWVGFYQDLKGENNMLYFVNTNKLLNEDHQP